jgi:uncharacterized membrane protein
MNYMYAAVTGFIKMKIPSHMTVQPHEHNEGNILSSKRIYIPFLVLNFIFYNWETFLSNIAAFNF